MKTYLTYNHELRTETDSGTITTLLRKGWVEVPPPSFDAATEVLEWNGEWEVRPLTADELAAATDAVEADQNRTLLKQAIQKFKDGTATAAQIQRAIYYLLKQQL